MNMKQKILIIIMATMLLILISCKEETFGESQQNQYQEKTAENTQENNGPQSHQIWSASSEDGLVWTHDNLLLIEKASVPIPLLLPNGTIRIYYVDASTQPSTIGCSDSTDSGATVYKVACEIEGTGTVNVDPTIVMLDDGRYRLYYFAGETDPTNGIGDPASMPGDHNINSAISEDGIHFEEEGTVFTYEGLMDPDIFYTGEQYLFYSATNTGKSIIATSDDGLDFTYYGDFPIERVGLAKPIILEDGTFRMYVFNQTGQKQVLSLISEDGLSWTKEEGIRLEAPEGKEITDSQVVQLENGTYKMFFKISTASTPPTNKKKIE